ncbi:MULTISPECIES: hypothetical protein [unclassified Streptomyces]|jgi:hypothetical protein|uniref:hypothetical protein n=1 Tax=unclassified Streptomyces TaxID=2593676 RepID=UPI002DDBE173|nr:hypothetical protein [Streptomyces sp. NBC_00151]WRZ45561.1 hypothetical protein OG915_12840 [Streptomyces sp. NBC_00151]
MSDDHCATGGDGPGMESRDALDTAEQGGPPYAECVLCREPTEYPESHRGITLCPVCAWQEAQRTACSG